MERWFYTDTLMEDGKTRISVCAYNEIQARRFLENGWRPVEESARGGNETWLKRGRPGRSRKKDE